MKSYHIHIYIT